MSRRFVLAAMLAAAMAPAAVADEPPFEGAPVAIEMTPKAAEGVLP